MSEEQDRFEPWKPSEARFHPVQIRSRAYFLERTPEQNENHLNEQQHADYREYRWKFIQWE